jgi:hypothetical protein
MFALLHARPDTPSLRSREGRGGSNYSPMVSAHIKRFRTPVRSVNAPDGLLTDSAGQAEPLFFKPIFKQKNRYYGVSQ